MNSGAFFHVLEWLSLAAAVAAIVLGVVHVARKNSNFRVWMGGAFAAFMDGFIEGCPVGAPVGAGIAAANGNIHADFGGRHIVIELAHVLAVPFFSGLADLRAYQKATPFPNVFLPPGVFEAPLVLPQKEKQPQALQEHPKQPFSAHI